MVKRKNWKPSKSTVICSDHFERESYQRPPGIKKRALLKKNAVPTKFPTHPLSMQPTVAKKRRQLHRLNISTEPGPSSEGDKGTPVESDIAIKRGRPKTPNEVRIPALKRTVDKLRKRIIRLQTKARVQKNLLQILQKENKLQAMKMETINGCLSELVKNETKNKRRMKNREYSSGVKQFALTMYFYSPRAYAYLRKTLTLPNPRTLRRWLQSYDCSPGFLTEVMERVGQQSDTNQLYSLVVDSMAICKRLTVNKSTKRVDGYVTVGADHSKLASEALVFLLVPVTRSSSYPIAYFFVDKIQSDLQSQLILQCLQLAAEKRIKIISITCDGCAANMTTLTKLGAEIPRRPYFTHPVSQHEVSVCLDAVHMLKLARNAFATYRRFQSRSGTIDYKYIEDLVDLQEDMGLHLANKVTKRHLNWHNVKMKVKLAAQLLSASVADALEYLSKLNDNFRNAGATTEFIRHVSSKIVS
jgi:hypothetical protein